MRTAYIDTSAVGKLLVDEAESAALAAHLDGLAEGELVSSSLLETELRRMAVRHSLPQADVTTILEGVTLILPDGDFFRRAGLLPGTGLRSLDALHLVTAMAAEAAVLLTYDHRMREAARVIGQPTSSPS